jgi:hypothetical protein
MIGRSLVMSLVVGAIAAPIAAADTTIGDTALTANSGAPIASGQGIPVFQGNAGGGYTLSAPAAGDLTSWSFRTAGADTGSEYELVVLAPVDQAGTTWRLVAESPPQTVTSAGGTDAVMGPFALSPAIGIDAGSRIALLPVNTSSVPIEQGVNTVDGIRYFTQPFAGLDSSQSVASTADNGQVVPIQATIGSASPPPPAPPVDQSPPSISGTPKDGSVLTCNPGTWSGAPTFSYAWSVTQPVVIGGTGNGKIRIPVHVEQVTTPIGTGQTVIVDDYVPGSSTISCTVTASNAAGQASATAPAVKVLATRPVLVNCASLQARLRLGCHPSITEGVGFGGQNVCQVGRWLHHPSLYRFIWYSYPRKNTPRTKWRIVGRSPTLTIGNAEELQYLRCRVTASNSAGSSIAYTNVYFVPQKAPVPSGGDQIRVIIPSEPASRRTNPDTSAANPLAEDSHWRQELGCTPPQFNRPAGIVQWWQVVSGGYDEIFDGPILRIDTWQAPLSVSTLDGDGNVLTSERPDGLNGRVVEVQCFVDAVLSHADAVVWSKKVYLDVHVAPPGTPDPYPGL